LDGWIDLAGDGVFDHKADQFLDVVLPVVPGYTELEWEYGALGLDGDAIQDKYARVRLTVIDDPGNMWPGGVDELTDVTPDSENLAAEDGLLVPGLSHGEVEDYYVPEPATLVLLGTGLAALAGRRRRR
ncbi:MAG: PEP-CTERM sorting domain-containing protein, partial [Planctomycetota bacterium]